VDAEAFVRELALMEEPELRAVAELVRHDALSAEGELAWWRATTEVGAMLRSARCGRRAAVVAHDAVLAVRSAAERCGMLTAERELITAVARAAAEAARALVADPRGAGVSQVLVTPFRPVVWELATV
jgi:UDP-3-O-acyl-N-acetylglucosamine deacetylase